MPKTGTEKSKSNAITAIILAAGQSSRMGSFKPLLPFGDKTVIESCIQNLRDAGLENIVVVVSVGPSAVALRKQLKSGGVRFAVNPNPESEMSASIAAAVRSVPDGTNAVIINPVDHAAVPADVIRLLINEWINGAPLVKPTWNGRGGHPVLIDFSFREKLLNLDPDGGLQAFLKLHQSEVTRVPVNSNLIARDMNTWDDYRSLHQEVFGVLPAKPPITERIGSNERTSAESN